MGIYEVDAAGMNILSIECSVKQASLALYGPSSVQRSWTAPRNHDSLLFPALQDALEILGDEPLDDILVGAGPGSYGGVRVALAAAEGLALVRGSRVVALCSWEPISAMCGCSVLSNAKRGGWALRRPGGEPQVLSTQDVLELVESGEDIRSIESADTLTKGGLRLQHVGLIPTAQSLIDYWLGLNAETQRRLAALPACPVYVRPPHITTPKHRPWEVKK